MTIIAVSGIPDGEYCKDCRFKEEDNWSATTDYCFAFEKALISPVRKLKECINSEQENQEEGFW